MCRRNHRCFHLSFLESLTHPPPPRIHLTTATGTGQGQGQGQDQGPAADLVQQLVPAGRGGGRQQEGTANRLAAHRREPCRGVYTWLQHSMCRHIHMCLHLSFLESLTPPLHLTTAAGTGQAQAQAQGQGQVSAALPTHILEVPAPQPIQKSVPAGRGGGAGNRKGQPTGLLPTKGSLVGV
jgi:hypothetical protein